MLMDLLFDGIIGGFECLGDTIGFGPIQAAKIHTSLIPEAERASRRILRDIDKPSNISLSSIANEEKSFLLKLKENTNVITSRKLTDDNLEKFSALIEDIKANFSAESNNIDLGLIYDYHRLNVHGKVILDKISSKKSSEAIDFSKEERLKKGFLFKRKMPERGV